MVEVARERGAANVTVAPLVERAGVSRRTFYELFADREECFLAAFDDGIARASRYILEGYEPEASWTARTRSALTALLSFLDSERSVGRLLIVDSLGGGAGALERRRRILAQIVAVVDEGRTEAKPGVELPPLAAEGIAGGVLSVLHSRLLEDTPESLLELTGPLMSMIVLPYLGPAAARRELARPVPKTPVGLNRVEGNPLGHLEMRLTYRTVRVLIAIAEHQGASNRAIADASEVHDQGQISKLLARLHKLGLIENAGGGAARGEPNAWTLTEKGWSFQSAITK
ncbi:MAG TPA: TetR family transcriptional regulator [Solirubrobacteraceae bacterium]|nr:TetR family transcriptional regulator [Solirubrobacteraceae bacterium]